MQLKFDRLAGQPPGEDKTYSVSQIVRLAARQLESRFADVWIEGEISNLRLPSSGHVYFTLKDAQAQLAVVMFRSALGRLKFRLENGLKIRCRGRLSIYDVQGRFQLTAETAEPEGTGALQLAFEQLKRKLAAEGLFSRPKKLLPLLPQTIAVVTSPTGAALRDILRVLHDRFPVRVIICPAAVQGNEAPDEIVYALRCADRLQPDLIIVGRGGGSLEDLWSFNTEKVARAIVALQTPVIAAVGHEVDITIADLVADHRAPTPTAAAEMAVPKQQELQELFRVQLARLYRATQHQLSSKQVLIERLCRRLGSPASLIDRSRLRLDDLQVRLEGGLNQTLRRRRDQLTSGQSRLMAQEPRVRLARRRATLDELGNRLVTLCQRHLAQEQRTLGELVGKLDALSPLAVLARGYSLVLDVEERVVREASVLTPGDRVTVRFQHGKARCIVDQLG